MQAAIALSGRSYLAATSIAMTGELNSFTELCYYYTLSSLVSCGEIADMFHAISGLELSESVCTIEMV